MIGFSKEYPAKFVLSRGKIQVRYNIKPITTPDGEAGYQYDYCYAEKATADSVIEALRKAAVDKPEDTLAAIIDKDVAVKVTELDPVTLRPMEPAPIEASEIAKVSEIEEPEEDIVK